MFSQSNGRYEAVRRHIAKLDSHNYSPNNARQPNQSQQDSRNLRPKDRKKTKQSSSKKPGKFKCLKSSPGRRAEPKAHHDYVHHDYFQGGSYQIEPFKAPPSNRIVAQTLNSFEDLYPAQEGDKDEADMSSADSFDSSPMRSSLRHQSSMRHRKLDRYTSPRVSLHVVRGEKAHKDHQKTAKLKHPHQSPKKKGKKTARLTATYQTSRDVYYKKKMMNGKSARDNGNGGGALTKQRYSSNYQGDHGRRLLNKNSNLDIMAAQRSPRYPSRAQPPMQSTPQDVSTTREADAD